MEGEEIKRIEAYAEIKNNKEEVKEEVKIPQLLNWPIWYTTK